MKIENGSIFDQMIAECVREDEKSRKLESVMFPDGRVSRKVPLRYRIIAAAFAEHSTLEELNTTLMENDCPRLYSRNLWEAGLIYAFSRRMPYQEWRRLEMNISELPDPLVQDQSGFGKRITFDALRHYVEQNSEKDPEMRTAHLTKVMENRLLELSRGDDDSGFRSFILSNLLAFSPVREKTRYYFCKYLYFYISTKVESYVKLRESPYPVSPLVEEAVLDDLAVLRGVTKLRRKKTTAGEARTILGESAISCGEVFDAFNYFFYGYVSLDWMDVLMDYYGDMKRLDPGEKAELAEAFRHYDKKLRDLSDDQVIVLKQKELREKEAELDAVYSRKNPVKGYQRNRSGENTIRRYLKGALDLDRMTLICFLLFFGSEADLTPDMFIDRGRMDDILQECGFSRLREENDFDDFVIRYMEAGNPSALLMQEVTEHAENEENFYLYKVYLSSRSEDQELKKIIGLA